MPRVEQLESRLCPEVPPLPYAPAPLLPPLGPQPPAVVLPAPLVMNLLGGAGANVLYAVAQVGVQSPVARRE